ncbi:hypothetical protein KKB99_02125, partial [bacterium]|nr:hypothetical protein [bacterium]MBU1024784.1 hypothetical protein [bacterium]
GMCCGLPVCILGAHGRPDSMCCGLPVCILGAPAPKERVVPTACAADFQSASWERGRPDGMFNSRICRRDDRAPRECNSFLITHICFGQISKFICYN